MRAGLLTRLRRGLAAQAFANLVRVITQVASVPLFLAYWGVELYGEWLVLIALLTYLELSDIGFTTATGNEMAMRVGAGDRAGALGLFQSTSLLLLLISLIVFTLIAPVVLAIGPVVAVLNIQQLSPGDVQLIMVLLATTMAVHFQQGLLLAGFRCEGNYGLGTAINASGTLLIFMGVAATVMLGGGPVAAAACQSLGRTVQLGAARYILRRVSPWLKYGRAHAELGVVRRLLRPSVAFMAFPISTGLVQQGTVVVLGAVLGPPAVVTFNTLRMLGGYAQHLSAMLSAIAVPEMSMAYGSNDRGLLRRLHRRLFQVNLWMTGLTCAALAVAGDLIVRIWTGGRVEMVWAVYLLLLGATLLRNLRQISSGVLYATNHHHWLAVVNLGLSTAALGSIYVGASTAGLVAVAAVLLGRDTALLLYVHRSVSVFLREDLRAFFLAALTPPLRQVGAVLDLSRLNKPSQP